MSDGKHILNNFTVHRNFESNDIKIKNITDILDFFIREIRSIRAMFFVLLVATLIYDLGLIAHRMLPPCLK